MNVPLPPGATGDVYLQAFDEVIAPVVERFAPTWLLISAGFDAHRDDPLTELGLTAGDFPLLTARALQLVPPGRCVAMLEGGYDLDALSACAAAVLGDARRRRPSSAEAPSSGGPGAAAVAAVRAGLGRRARTPDRGAARSLPVAMVPARFAPVLDELAPLAARFAAAGHRLYLVGGAVRDLLVGVERRATTTST